MPTRTRSSGAFRSRSSCAIRESVLDIASSSRSRLVAARSGTCVVSLTPFRPRWTGLKVAGFYRRWLTAAAFGFGWQPSPVPGASDVVERPAAPGVLTLLALRLRALDRPLITLGALVISSTAVRFVLSRGVAAPWIAPDEQLYGMLGRSLVEGHHLRLLGQPVPYYSTLYPLLVGLPFLWSDATGSVRDVQALQALVMSLTAIPVFLWARPLTGPRWALVAAGLSVLIPGLVYSGLFMSEALYYPLATFTAFALARCLEQPTLARQLLLLCAIAAALATRLQAIGFAGVVVVAVALLAVAQRSRMPIRRMLPTLAVLTFGAVAYASSRVFAGGGSQLLGGYATLGHARAYSPADIAQWIAWQTGALTLVTVGIPLIALGVLTWEILSRHERDAGMQALVIAAVAYVSVTVLEVSAFASRFVEHVTERQLLSILPP